METSIDINILNLKSIATLAVLKSVWDKLVKGKISKNCAECEEIDVPYFAEDFRAEVIEDSIRFLKSLSLPISMLDDIIVSSAIMGNKLISWLGTFRRHFGLFFEGEIYWTFYGNVDAGKTIQHFQNHLFNDDTHLGKYKYHMSKLNALPCLYPDEEFIRAHKDYMIKASLDFKIPPWFNINILQDENDDIHVIIIKGIIEILATVILLPMIEGTENVNVVMCRICVEVGYFEAFKYFWEKLTCHHRQEIHIALEELSNAQSKRSFGPFSSFRIDFKISLFLFNPLKFVKEIQNNAITSENIFPNLIIFSENEPFPGFYLSLLKNIWDFLTDVDFKIIIHWIGIKICFCRCFDHNEILLKYYFEMAEKIWMNFTKEIKEQIVGPFFNAACSPQLMNYILFATTCKWENFPFFLSFFNFLYNDADIKSKRKNLCETIINIIVMYLNFFHFEYEIDMLVLDKIYSEIFIFPEEKDLFSRIPAMLTQRTFRDRSRAIQRGLDPDRKYKLILKWFEKNELLQSAQ